MKKISIFLVVLLLSSSMILFTQASTSNQRVSADTGEVEVTHGVKVRIVYDASVSITRPESAKAGENENWDVRVSDGQLSLSVYVPSPISKWYTVSKSVPIGSGMDIPLGTGISANVNIQSSCPVNVQGAASADANSLSWESEGTKFVTLSINSNAKAGDVITVQLPFSFQIKVGIGISFLLFSYELASMDIGTYNAMPSITETISIPAAPFDFTLILIAAVVSIAIVVPMAIFVFVRLRRRKSLPPPPPPLP
jgi:hypothetical protein